MKRVLVDETEPSRPSKLKTDQRNSGSSSDDDVIVDVDVEVCFGMVRKLQVFP
jgi:hypothetical protein